MALPASLISFLISCNYPGRDKEQRISRLSHHCTSLRPEPWLVHYAKPTRVDCGGGDEILRGEYLDQARRVRFHSASRVIIACCPVEGPKP